MFPFSPAQEKPWFLLIKLGIQEALQDLGCWTRDGTPSLAMKALNSNHWTTREFPLLFLSR